MITNVDVRLKYQIETGHNIRKTLSTPTYLPVQEYIDWLEEIAVAAMAFEQAAKNMGTFGDTLVEKQKIQKQ